MAEKKVEIAELLDQIRAQIKDDDFLHGRGTSNEENIHIYGYDPQDEMIVRHFVSQLEQSRNLPCHLHSYNLYRVFLEIVKDKPKIYERIPQMEEQKGSSFLLDRVQKIASPQAFVKKMAYEPHQLGKDVVLLSGIGSVYPFMRTHTLLEALQPVFSDVPIIVLFPGGYSGRDLTLFHLLTPHEYYRAFNLH